MSKNVLWKIHGKNVMNGQKKTIFMQSKNVFPNYQKHLLTYINMENLVIMK